MALIGINQNSFHRQEGGFPSFEDMIRGIGELGLNLFEFCPEYLEQTPDVLTPQRRREALALAKSLGIKLLVHASFASVNCCFINDHTRAESVRQLKREIELAHDLESDSITIHPGSPVGHAKWYPKAHFWDIVTKSYEELLAHAEPLGVRICTENLSKSFVGTIEHLEQLFADLDSPNFGLTFDFGHHNLIYNDQPLALRTDLMVDLLERFKERVWVLHIHDNKGMRDDHKALGWGDIDYRAGMRKVVQAGINAFWSMELDSFDDAVTTKRTLAEFE